MGFSRVRNAPWIQECISSPVAIWVLVCLASCSHGEKAGTQVYFWDNDGWSCHDRGRGCSHFRVMRGALVGEDDDESVWFFSAPSPFIRKFQCASAFAFRLAHPEFDSKGADLIEEFDVILSSSVANASVGLRGLVRPWQAHRDMCVVLPGRGISKEQDQDAAATRCEERMRGLGQTDAPVRDGWLDVRTLEAVSDDDVLNVLATADALQIRGGFYRGREVTYLDKVWVFGDMSCQWARVSGEPGRSSGSAECETQEAVVLLDTDEIEESNFERTADGANLVEAEAIQTCQGTGAGCDPRGTSNAPQEHVEEETEDGVEDPDGNASEPQDAHEGRPESLEEQGLAEEQAESDGGEEIQAASDASQGSAREEGQSALEECLGLQRQWGVQPCVTWGRAGTEWLVQERWAGLGCDAHLGARCVFAEEQGGEEAEQEGAEAFAEGRACLEWYRRRGAARGGRWAWAGGLNFGQAEDGGQGRPAGVPGWVESEEEMVACAVEALREGRAAGHRGAVRLLGEMVEFGEGGEKVWREMGGGGEGEGRRRVAERLYLEAAAQGDGEAEWALSVASAEQGMWEGGGAEAGGRWEQAAVEHRYKAATLGSEEAMLGMGSRAYEAAGVGVLAERGRAEADGEGGAEEGRRRAGKCEEAFQWYRAAADKAARAIQESGGSEAETEQVRLSELEFDERRDERESAGEQSWLQEVAVRGSGEEAVEAQVKVAVRKFHGVKGAEKDVEQGAEFLQMAAMAGDGTALANYGYMLANGWGVERDVAKAAQHFEQAIALGDAGGHVGMGFLYAHGMGEFSQDHAMAFEHYAKAAEMGDVQAMFNVGEMFRVGQGVEVDHNKSFELFRAAALQGHFKGMLLLGLSYWYGWGVEHNCADAVYLLKLVAERGPKGRVLREAYSAYKEHDYGKAYRLYLRAAEAGYEVGQCNVAMMTRRREGTDIGRSDDELQRLEKGWWVRASRQGSGEAAVALGKEAADEGRYEEARMLFERALVQGDKFGGKAALALGNMYESGQGVEPDREKARALYKLAGRGGSEDQISSTVAQTVLEAKTMWDGFVEGVKGFFGW